MVGRDFTYAEDRPGQDNQVAILSHRLWKRRFGGNPRIAGTTVSLNDRAFTVIGVLPPGTPWLNSADIFVPMVHRPTPIEAASSSP